MDLQALDEGGRAKWPASAAVAAQRFQFVRCPILGQERLPVRCQCQQRGDVDQQIVPPREVRAGARPGPVLGPARQPGADRIEFDVARSGSRWLSSMGKEWKRSCHR